MLGLHDGHLRPAALAGAALTACLTLVGLTTMPASAETVGGDQLASLNRTVSLQEGAQPLPDVWAQTWILADAETGEVLAQKGAHVRRAPASTLKMLTALAVMPNTTPETTYVATTRAATIYGARVGLKPGRTYTLDQLWYAVFLPSANDAAIAVAQANGGVHKTVRQMNEVARELNALDTVARNTNGLDAPHQLSSAYDLALFARAGLQRPDFAKYASTPRAEFPNVKGKGSHPIYTTNRLLLHGWKGVIGVKTGFTSQAGRTYVGAATRGGRTLIVSLMGIHEASETAAKKLLKWGFRNADKVTPIGALVEPGALPAPTDAAQPGDGSTAAPESSGAGTTAAAASSSGDSTMPPVALWGAVALAVGAGVIVLLRRRVRPVGRHSAR
jgi:serine-type D-Ala-D-Ala carboxypeptidase (penicillin-binding protein 5/6)